MDPSATICERITKPSVHELQLRYFRNSDPLRQRTDAELISILRRCWLLPSEEASVDDTTAELKFNLDAAVGDDGECRG